MRQFILGTDWWTDCDDAVAVRILARAHLAGQCRLLGVGMNACMPYSAPSLRAFMDQEGLSEIPLAIDREATDFGGKPAYQENFAKKYAPHLRNTDFPDSLSLYRKLLADAEGPVEILEIGYPQMLSALLQSGPDEFSPKTGLELISQKVTKLWIMAGKWDGDGEKENNFCRNPRSRVAGEILCRLWPTPTTFLGWEVGYGILTGGELSKDDPLRQIMADHGSAVGRHSWDPMLVLLALTGNEADAGYDIRKGWATLDADTGANHFTPDPHGPHQYVIKREPDGYYRDAINRLIDSNRR